MSDFPSYTRSARKGEKGIGLVSTIINDDYEWLFKRNHQEHDFGSDGQIEFVTEEGHVTGQMLAVQIKYGSTFFKEKNRWGWTYRGEKKHFNYLSNYPAPVLIVICDPNMSECYWAHFVPTDAEETETGWKINIPFDQNLKRDQAKIHALLPPVRNLASELQSFWALNRVMIDSELILCALSKDDVIHKSIRNVRAFLDRLLSKKELAFHCQGKVEFFVHGYDDDPRELWEIKEFLEYIPTLDAALHEIFFFGNTKPPASFLVLLMLCQSRAKWVGARPRVGTKGKVTFSSKHAGKFIGRHFLELNDITGWLGMSHAENTKITFDVVQCLGFKIPKKYQV